MNDEINDALLIYNPTSGRRRNRRFADVEQAARILKEAGIATELAPTTARDSATKIARQAVAQKRGMVIVCGGDGTINETVNGLVGSQIPMALLPAGTANILAKELGIPWDIPRAARLIRSATIRRVAVGLACPLNGNASAALPASGRYFLCVAGAGPDGAIVNGVDEVLKKRVGVLAYWAEGLKQFFRYNFPPLCVESEGLQRAATLIVIGRTAHYGGPFKITTGANLFEDSFELVTHSKSSRLSFLLCLPAVWLGKLRSVDGIQAWKSVEVICQAEGAEAVFAQVDGEPIGAVPIAFRIVPDALSLLVPAKSR